VTCCQYNSEGRIEVGCEAGLLGWITKGIVGRNGCSSVLRRMIIEIVSEIFNVSL